MLRGEKPPPAQKAKQLLSTHYFLFHFVCVRDFQLLLHCISAPPPDTHRNSNLPFLLAIRFSLVETWRKHILFFFSPRPMFKKFNFQEKQMKCTGVTSSTAVLCVSNDVPLESLGFWPRNGAGVSQSGHKLQSRKLK